ncbi:dihydroorotate dehydrogenase (quinone) [Candidatus Endobugula sertula]|uniref:Dihydroorotate dehydrogenase (quinone) n=1 Tax=Candidatus Endobugula sertula TaxID=62101 RepID=A0A1D2QLL7_9GAMM|nr:dihydroorotate dehydrogenase (quinone) [Candidatus Endobugula sertula]
MYPLLRKLLFSLDPEMSHALSLDCLGAAERLKLLSLLIPDIPQDPVEVLGLTFPNPVGLSAGLDKNGDYFNALGQLGFGFVEIGTVTPKAQRGNPKPRLFRLPEHQAIINRMGFNNKGVDYLVERVKRRRYQGILGINIGKNKTTPEKDALSDYEMAMEKVYPYADYITVNISSPNTPGLRNLQFGDRLDCLLAGLSIKQQQLSEQYERKVPVLVKISPDMSDDEIASVSEIFLKHEVDGVIATNTTLDREMVSGNPYSSEAGGLSGSPIIGKSTHMIQQLRFHIGPNIPIIGVGGIFQGSDAVEKLEAGATLVQVYTGFIYQGPKLILDSRRAIMDYKALI